MTLRVIDQHSLRGIAKWIITQRQAEDRQFLEEGPIIMASRQVPKPPPLSQLFKQNPGLCRVMGQSQALPCAQVE